MPSRRSSDSDSSRSSGSSSSAHNSSHFSRSHSPSPENQPPGGIHSSPALILVHDDDEQENDNSSFSFSDEEDTDGLQVFDSRSDTPSSPSLSAPSPLLPPSTAFVHFLAPCLKLGAVATLTSHLPLKLAIPALLLFSLLAAFARQIWFLLARYVRKADLADIAIEAFTKRKGQDKRKKIIRESTRWVSILTRWLLAVVYLRASASTLTPILPHTILLVPSHAFLTAIFTIALLPLVTAKSHASRRLTYTAWASVAIYITWLCAVIFAHNVGSVDSDAFPELTGALTRDIPLVAFTFSTLSTLQLYAGVVQPSISRGSGVGFAGKREKRFQAISSASLAAALLSTALVLPLVFPRIKPVGHQYQEPDSFATEATHVHAIASTLTSFLLLTGIPTLFATAPVLPLPLPTVFQQRLSPSGGIGDSLRNASKCVMLAAAMVVSMIIPGGNAGGMVGRCLEDLTLVLVLAGSFFLPALLHITLHAFRRPLSIIIPPSPLTDTSPTHRTPPNVSNNRNKYNSTTSDYSSRPNIQRASSSSDSDSHDDADVTTPLTRTPGVGTSLQAHPHSRPRDASSGTPRERTFKTPSSQLPSSSSNTHLPSSSHSSRPHRHAHFSSSHFPPSPPPPPPPDPTTETLLQRKERALQRRRLGRRVFWDIGVWLGLAPISVGGFVWAIGRLVGSW